MLNYSTFESFALDTQLVDPYIGFFGDNLTNNPNVSGNITGQLNYNYKVNLEAGTTYYFAIMLENDIKTAKTFEICISK